MAKSKWKQRHLLGLKDLSADEITTILDTTTSFVEISQRAVKKVPTLRGKTICNFFFEPSTRTRASFELAEKRLSADTINFAGSSSSLVKGETVKDTARNIEALKVDMIVIRHGSSGVPHQLSRYVDSHIVNAGDGINEHPTQALLDMYTLRQKRGALKGLKVTIVGDILHSRVARSNIWGLTKLGAQVTVCGPKTLIPYDVEGLGVRVSHSITEAIEGADAVNILRIQKERQNEIFFPSIREYSRTFQVNKEIIKRAKKDVVIMHPGPMNRGVEITGDVADSENSVILNQVTNGIAVRMAVLYLLSGV